MSFMDAIKKLKTKFQKPVSKSEQEKKYKNVLSQLIDHADRVYSTAVKSPLPCLYIYPASNANIDLIQGMYADLGINLKKHTSHLDGKKVDVLYISTPDILSLSEHQQKFLEQTAPTKQRGFVTNNVATNIANNKQH